MEAFNGIKEDLYGKAGLSEFKMESTEENWELEILKFYKTLIRLSLLFSVSVYIIPHMIKYMTISKIFLSITIKVKL